jgi:hypothetical protein
MTTPGRKLVRADYADPRPTRAARFFLGKFLCVAAPDGYAEGMILETEAYGGIEDAASHGFGYRRTPRTEIIFAPGGVSYVYLCYGLHHLFNIVTGPADSPEAVLIRAVRITAGREIVRRRRAGVAEKVGERSREGERSAGHRPAPLRRRPDGGNHLGRGSRRESSGPRSAKDAPDRGRLRRRLGIEAVAIRMETDGGEKGRLNA